MMEQPALEFSNVCFSYGDRLVLEDVTFAIETGQCVGMIGPNGGGKTTLVRLALGLLKPNRGEIRVVGHTPHTGCRRVGYVPQHVQYDRKFPVTALELVLMGRLDRLPWWGRYGVTDREAARRALDEVGLSDVAERPFADLSGGQRQRVLIARALVGEPEILLLDEPTANVDLTVEELFLRTLDALKQRLTILLVTHDLGLLEQLTGDALCVNRRVHRHELRDLDGGALREIYSGARRERHFGPAGLGHAHE